MPSSAPARGGRVSEVRLYPIDLGYSSQFVEYGIPRLATAAQAQKTLKRLQELSAPLGTTVAIEGNVGIIRPSAPQSSQAAR